MPTSTAVVLAIDTNCDACTTAAFNYRNVNVYPFLEVRGFTVALCQGLQAKQAVVVPLAKQIDVCYITGSGHGIPTAYQGANNATIFAVGQYDPQDVKGKIIHLFSCDVALQLGKDFVTNGCQAFLGYDQPIAGPAQYEDVFVQCDAQIDLGFASGLTAADAKQRAISLYNSKIAEFGNLGTELGNYTASALRCARDHLQLYGQQDAKLTPGQSPKGTEMA
jgi:hypothetical protein